MLEAISFLVIAMFFMVLITLYQHYRDRPQYKTKKNVIPANSVSSTGNLWLLEQGYVENKKLWNMLSLDNGFTWYVVEHGVLEKERRRTLEERHSQVLTHAQAWEKLKLYVRKNGPISLRDDRGISLLRKAGFEVRVRGTAQEVGV